MPAAASGFQDRLRRLAEGSRREMATARGLSAGTYRAVVQRALEVEGWLRQRGAGAEELEAVRTTMRALQDVDRLTVSRGPEPSAGAEEVVPPPNSEVYAAAVDITELHGIVAALGSIGGAWEGALRAHLAGPTVLGRLGLSLASLCRRAGLRPGLHGDPGRGGSLVIELDHWPVTFGLAEAVDADSGRHSGEPRAAAPGPAESPEPPGPAGAGDASQAGPDESAGWSGAVGAARSAGAALAQVGRAGMLALECGGAIPPPPGGIVRGADDRAVVAALGHRLESWLLEARGAMVGAVSLDHAFGAVAHATLAGLNVASGHLVIAEVWRAVNLCELNDPRIARLGTFMRAIERI